MGRFLLRKERPAVDESKRDRFVTTIIKIKMGGGGGALELCRLDLVTKVKRFENITQEEFGPGD